jgi:hypothetical protein
LFQGLGDEGYHAIAAILLFGDMTRKCLNMSAFKIFSTKVSLHWRNMIAKKYDKPPK